MSTPDNESNPLQHAVEVICYALHEAQIPPHIGMAACAATIATAGAQAGWKKEDIVQTFIATVDRVYEHADERRAMQ